MNRVQSTLHVAFVPLMFVQLYLRCIMPKFLSTPQLLMTLEHSHVSQVLHQLSILAIFLAFEPRSICPRDH